MKRYENLINSFRAAGFGLLAAAGTLFTACDGEEFVRDAGDTPAALTERMPSGALYAQGSSETELQDYSIDDNTTVSVVYRLNFPAEEDVVVTLSIGTQEDADAYNDAKGLQNIDGNLGGFKRYKMLPETNYTQPEALTLTVPKGKTESAPLSFSVVYDKNLLTSFNGDQMLHPWMLPLRIESVQGAIVPLVVDQILHIGIRPADKKVQTDMFETPTEWLYPEQKEEGRVIAFVDCREVNPTYILNYYYYTSEYKYVDMGGFGWVEEDPETSRYYTMYDVECLQPLFISYDADTETAGLKTDADLMYVLTHQERYMNPQRDCHIKLCVSVETEAKSPVGLCNLDDDARASLVWKIANFVEKYDLDGVALDDAGANYAAAGAPAVDKTSYTRFLKALREALGDNKLIMLSYDGSANSALYDEHDGLRAGDYIDYAWWGTENELCTPYAVDATVKPIAGLAADRFCPLAGKSVDTPAFHAIYDSSYAGDNPLGVSDVVYYARELADQGQFSVAVDLKICARTQNFYESFQNAVPAAIGIIFLSETDLDQTPGGLALADLIPGALNNPWGQGGYGAGLKDW